MTLCHHLVETNDYCLCNLKWQHLALTMAPF
uniref:Uncharacterized protein n=1 Tax=Rhizophora mucronata TaxID=61149 RepID=A0A2P2IHZ0_RHIMU